MEKIYHNKILLGICVRKFSLGTKAITLNSEPLQAVALKHKKGEAAKPHLHANYPRKVVKTQSCFIVRKGKIRVDVYNNKKKLIKSLSLGAGDFYISSAGGHGIKYLANAEVIEIKNGPFKEDKVLISQ